MWASLSLHFAVSYRATIRNRTRLCADSFSFLCLEFFVLFLIITLPLLNDSVTHRLEHSGAFDCRLISIFACLVVAHDFIVVVSETSWVLVLVATMVLKHSPCCWFIAIHRSTHNPPLATMPACYVMDMFSKPPALSRKPSNGWWWCVILCIEGSLARGVWDFDLLVWAIDNCSSFCTCFSLALKMTSFCKMRLTVDTWVCFSQFIDVFDEKGVSIMNHDCHYVI